MLNLGITLGFFVILALSISDLLIAYYSYNKGKLLGWALAKFCACSAFLGVVFCIRYFVSGKFGYSVLTSLFFITMAALFYFMFQFVRIYVGSKYSKKTVYVYWVVAALLAIDVVFNCVNPFRDIVASFVANGSSIVGVKHGLYWYHMGLMFCVALASFLMLVLKTNSSPREYKSLYIYSLIAIAATLVAYFALSLPDALTDPYFGYIIALFSVCAHVFYWNCYYYSTHGLMDLFKSSVFESIDQGVVLFDRNNKKILNNELAMKFLPEESLEQFGTLRHFLTICGIPSVENTENETYSVQCVMEKNGVRIPLRCDYQLLKDRKSREIGKLFTFSNAVLETDLLTGFHNYDPFEVFVKDVNRKYDDTEVAAAVCDINGLSVINATKGRAAGDAQLKEMASMFREFFPKTSYFVRGHDAYLIVVSFNMSEAMIRNIFDSISKRISTDFVYAISLGTRTADGILGAIDRATRALRQKKLMDRKSVHSSSLSSLICALQECDDDTEAHVKRTQMMGAELGRRLGFTDVQLSELSLLCLLHDIGKIGIPLEVLNKPGKLNADEWIVMKSHVEKGYQIAISSQELQGIADMIRYHHERWDGKGYPDGLSREAIPLLSRVISVVDSYDAMVSDRVYRKGMPQAAAFEELIRCSGSQFDPTIVSEFVHMLQEHPELAVAGKKTEVKNAVDPQTKPSPDQASLQLNMIQRKVVHCVEYMNYILDADTMKISSVNKAFERISGYTQKDVDELQLNQRDLIPEEDRTEYFCMVSEYLAKDTIAYFEHRFVRKNGNIIYVLCMGRLFFESSSKTSKIEVIVIDSSNTYVVQQVMANQMRRADQQLHQWENAYRRDPLTGLMSRTAFQSDVENHLQAGDHVMLLMLDVDRFKEFNDENGHNKGDEYLVLLAQTIESALRDDDLSCRMGGDEFAAAIIFKQECSRDSMYSRAQQIFDKINMSLNSSARGTTLSMGAVIADDNYNTFNKLYEASDKALYRSKESGRSRLTTI